MSGPTRGSSGFTDQKPRIATEADCRMLWSGGPNGKFFRCYLCGRKFKPGDVYRFFFSPGPGVGNGLTCETCDGPTVGDRYKALRVEYDDGCRGRFWSFVRHGGES